MSKLLVLILLSVLTSLAAGLPIEADDPFGADPSQNDVFIHKQFYTHTGPESHAERKVVFGKSKYNYKVVFINIPSPYARFIQNGHKPLSVSLAPVEERLALYVLSEKVDQPDEEVVNIDTQTRTEPPPPEVHFIKYKDPQEAAEVQSQIMDQYADIGSR